MITARPVRPLDQIVHLEHLDGPQHDDRTRLELHAVEDTRPGGSADEPRRDIDRHDEQVFVGQLHQATVGRVRHDAPGVRLRDRAPTPPGRDANAHAEPSTEGNDAMKATNAAPQAPAVPTDCWPPDAHHVVSVSGGKDSTCTYRLAVEILGRDGFTAVFADTGWEHADTYAYVKALPDLAGGPPIQWVKRQPSTHKQVGQRAQRIGQHFEKNGIDEHDFRTGLARRTILADAFHDHPFKQLTMMRGGFPSNRMRFCTDQLKIVPIEQQVLRPYLEAGRSVVSWQGVRADESPSRRLLPPVQRLRPRAGYDGKLWTWRPILDWTLDDVKAFAHDRNIPLNPLYDRGLSRVGCWPCIFARKAEIKRIAELDPARIDEIAEWEIEQNKVNASKQATFFQAKQNPANKPPFNFEDHGVRSIVEWSKTPHGGRPRDPVLHGLEELFLTECDQWGACE